MPKRVFLVASLSLVLVTAAGIALGATTKAFLEPKPLTGTSDAILLKGDIPRRDNVTLGAQYWLAYDNGSESGSLGGLASIDTIVVWFKSPAACSLLEIHVLMYSDGDFDLLAADAADTINFKNDYEEYHGGSTPGPSPIGTLFQIDTGLHNTGQGWQVLTLTNPPDVDTNVFVGGYVLESPAGPGPIIDASVPKPSEGYHTLMARNPSPPVQYGWYASYHHVYIRALVNLYKNPPPFISSMTRLPDTYQRTGRYVEAALWDIGVPSESTGVLGARILYTVNGGVEDTLPLTLISGTRASGTWAGYMRPAAVGDTVSYRISALDLQGAEKVGSARSYVIRAGQSTAELLFVNEDYYGITCDPVAAVVPDSVYDRWESSDYGLPDASVLGFGYKAILWNTWDGTGSYGFAADADRIAEFLDGGGALMVSTQDMPGGGFGYGFGEYTTSPGDFCYDYLHLMGGTDDYAGDTISVYFGVPGDPITGDFADWPVTSFPYGPFGAGYNYAGSCVIDKNDLNVSAIFYDVGDPISGYKYDLAGSYKIVYLYWPFNYLVNLDGSPDTVNQNILIANVMTWFGVDPVGIAERLQDRLTTRSKSVLLWQNWPNPACGPTTISFNIPEPTHASVRIYNIAGRSVNTLLDGYVDAGRHSLKWDGRDELGREVPSGVYIYRLSAGTSHMAKKMVLLR
jgi:hypothetical protein